MILFIIQHHAYFSQLGLQLTFTTSVISGGSQSVAATVAATIAATILPCIRHVNYHAYGAVPIVSARGFCLCCTIHYAIDAGNGHRYMYAYWAIQIADMYEGRPINKLQNGIILLIFKI